MDVEHTYDSRSDVIAESHLVAWNPCRVWIYRALIFPTGNSRSQLVWTDVHISSPSCQPFWVQELDLSRWFPCGIEGVHITHVPGTSYKLKNSFYIFFAPDTVSSVANASMASIYGTHWHGNVVVVKAAARYCGRVVQMTGKDISLAETLVGLEGRSPVKPQFLPLYFLSFRQATTQHSLSIDIFLASIRPDFVRFAMAFNEIGVNSAEAIQLLVSCAADVCREFLRSNLAGKANALDINTHLDALYINQLQ
ncbi:hypothetical protein BJ138DRAFT_1114896 [Hygrophoropsis aurantiaca]|uniref:Uncharacterized protein n=1 Tax=Hygrophoropsis aurantiaca TaxID=72124 RepID=A0ACB8A8C1_9AGAM|nr:hypothetical protein BJ138DRAFT_1114896 [Hygrophoropsis aurantiaca]